MNSPSNHQPLAMAVAAAAIALLAIAVLIYRAATADVRERAAWNEGYYGVDHQTALALAEAGVGKSADVKRQRKRRGKIRN